MFFFENISQQEIELRRECTLFVESSVLFAKKLVLQFFTVFCQAKKTRSEQKKFLKVFQLNFLGVFKANNSFGEREGQRQTGREREGDRREIE